MKKLTFLLLTIGLSASGYAQQKAHKGSVIKNYGETFTVDTPTFKTPINAPYKVVFDIGKSYSSDKMNPLFNTAARFINMHAEAGVPLNQIQVALVIHGSAAFDVLNDKEYQLKFGRTNPNTELLSVLKQNNVQLILCGQTAAHKNLKLSQLSPDIQLALSAMTALVQLQNNDYRLINF